MWSHVFTTIPSSVAFVKAAVFPAFYTFQKWAHATLAAVRTCPTSPVNCHGVSRKNLLHLIIGFAEEIRQRSAPFGSFIPDLGPWLSGPDITRVACIYVLLCLVVFPNVLISELPYFRISARNIVFCHIS